MKNILIVDDGPEQRELLGHALKGEGEFVLIYAESGEEALSFLEKNKIDLILSDLEMPNGDGFWLLEKLKALAERCPPVIILTGHLAITEVEVLNAGAIAFFRKPYCIKELVQSMKKWQC